MNTEELEYALANNHAIDAFEALKLPKEQAEMLRTAMVNLVQRSETAEAVVENLRGSLMSNRIGFYALGMGVGALTGYFIAKRLLGTKYSQIADSEIAEMREHYRAKGVALEAEYAKKPVEEIVKDRGYSSPDARTHIRPPMAVQPPRDVAESEDEKAGEPPDEPETKNVFTENQVTHEWDWHKERSRRSPDIPYVIHQDELHEMEYTEATLTYYEGDDVLCTDRDEPLDEADRERLIGEANLNRFGHGSGDASIVYVRNDQLELVYEVVKSPNHFAEEVHGFSHESYDRGNLERMRARERDDPEA